VYEFAKQAAYDEACRVYWKKKMDEADAFMADITSYPVEESREPLVSLPDAARASGVEVLFSEKPFVNGFPRLYYLREGLVTKFFAAAREMNSQGWLLKVEDGYRTASMQRELGINARIFAGVLKKVQWECGADIPPLDLLYRRLGSLVANTPKMGTHMSGSAVDISVVRRDSGLEIDRGASYLEMSEITPMESPFISDRAHMNREKITAMMAKCGFVAYPFEFWHYSSGDAYFEYIGKTGRPASYGPVHMDPSNGSVRQIDYPNEPINNPEAIHSMVNKLTT
jgi:zinc D-Ala-D-Ala dipeptidase